MKHDEHNSPVVYESTAPIDPPSIAEKQRLDNPSYGTVGEWKDALGPSRVVEIPETTTPIEIEHPAKYWYCSAPDDKYLIVKCGEAYLDVRIADGTTNIGYLDEEEYRPIIRPAGARNWATALLWVADQPWPEWTRP